MKKLTNKDIDLIATEFCKRYYGYVELCGMARILVVLDYISEIQYLCLADNFEQQYFENIPVAKTTYISILQR